MMFVAQVIFLLKHVLMSFAVRQNAYVEAFNELEKNSTGITRTISILLNLGLLGISSLQGVVCFTCAQAESLQLTDMVTRRDYSRIP